MSSVLSLKKKTFKCSIYGVDVELTPVTMGELEKLGDYNPEDDKNKLSTMKEIVTSHGISEELYNQISVEDMEAIVNLIMPKKKQS